MTLRDVTAGGAIAVVGVGVVTLAALGYGGLTVLFVALALTIASTHVGRARKEALGIAEDGVGRRGAANIVANCIVGTASAAFSPLMFVAGIAAGASDTVASEIGKAWGGKPRTFPTFETVPPGTPGAITVVGTIAGIAAAALIALPAVFYWLSLKDLALVVFASACGAFVESALATRLEHEGVLGNNTLNVINTAVAAAVVNLPSLLATSVP